MARIIGIDLGTTNTAVAVLDGGRPRVIEDDRGYKVLPSVVSAKGDGRFVVGQAAHNLILTRPDRTVFGCKRLMGRRFDSAEVQAVRKRVQYEIREAPDGGVQVQVGDQWMSPQEIAAVVLQVARTIAERALGEVVEEAVITVPAYFNHAQRKATLEAAQIAGIRCDRLLNEPTAAALAYGHRKTIEKTIAIFDLGGGTFDISVLHLQNGIYEILATSGDTFLGGDDFDWRVAEWLADAFQARTRVDLRQDRNAVQRLKDAAERAKCELSFSDRANIVIPHVTPEESIDTVLTRTKLEELTLDLVERACDIARKAVADAGLQMSDLDEVVLVGGQTRMPKVREMVSGVFGRDPSRSVHPEEAVAVGAAVHAANLSDADSEKVVLLDVTPFELGIDTARGTFVPIIERNARVPVSSTRTFATVHDDQAAVRVTVRQGQSRVASENEFLGEFLFEGLTPAKRLQTKVDVSFRIDSNGMLHVAAVEKGTGERRNITIRNYAEHAQAPSLPDAEQARLDAEARAKRYAEEAKALAAGLTIGAAAAVVGEAVAKAPKTAGVAKKKGLLDGLFGARTKAEKPAKAAKAGKAAKGAAKNGVAVAAAPAAIASDGMPPGEAVPEPEETAEAVAGPVPLDISGMELVDDEGEGSRIGSPAQLEPLDEELLYEETGATAGLGLAGSAGRADAAHGHEDSPWADAAGGSSADAMPLSMDELFGPADDRAPGDPFAAGGDPFGGGGVGDVGGFGPTRGAASGLPPEALGQEDAFDLGGGMEEVDDLGGEEGDLLDSGLAGEGEEVDVFGDGFALLGESDAGPVPAEQNPFGPDDHTEIDSEALAVLRSGGSPNLAAGAAGDADSIFSAEGLFGPDDTAEASPEEAQAIGDALTDAEPTATATLAMVDLEPLDEPSASGAEPEPLDDPYGSAPESEPLDDPFGAVAEPEPFDDPFARAAEPTPDEPFARAPEPTPEAPFARAPEAPPEDDPFAVDPAAAEPEAEAWGADPVAAEPEAEAWGADPVAAAAEPLGDLDLEFGALDAELPSLEPAPELGEDLFGAGSDPYAAEPHAPAEAEAPVEEAPPAEEEAPHVPSEPSETGFALMEGAAPVSSPHDWGAESEITRLNRRPPTPEPVPFAPDPSAGRRRKPARVKLQYRDFDVFVTEYRENLRRGGTFIRTEKPLPVGRECLFEIGAPGLDAPLVFPAVVTFVATAAPGQEAGMGVEYQLDDGGRHEIERVLNRV